MRTDPKSLVDGFSTIEGGMDSGNPPATIGRSKIAFGRNLQTRGGFLATRPGRRRRILTFADSSTRDLFEQGLFQGAGPFDPFDASNGGPRLLAQIGGRTFRIDVSLNYAVSDLTLPGDPNPATRPKSWFVQAEDFAIIQDGQSSPLIYDGVILRRVNPSAVPKEVPVGTVMEYSMGRLWVVLPQGRSFVAGDLVYSDTGTAAYNGRDAVLKFTENDFLNEGGEFGVPADVGLIRAMRTVAVLDTSLGQGPLQVLADRGAFSVDAPFDRTQWKNLQRPIQTVSLLGSGATSHEACIGINGDLWFRSGDGIRSFQVARRDFGSWVNTPLSSEMSKVIDHEDLSLLLHASATLFDNRYLLTSTPSRLAGHGIVWAGVTALDFHNVSGLGSRTAPAYDGLWTGIRVLQIVQLLDRCFLFVLNGANRIELWEQTKFDEFDNQDSATPTRIACYADTPAFNYADKGWDRKILTTGDLWVRDLAGVVNFRIQWRPDDHECWTDWHSWSVDSKRETCLDECGVPLSLLPQYRPRQRLPLPPDVCDARPDLPLRHGFQHQLRIAWDGMARFTKVRIVSHEWQEEAAPYCQPSEPTDLTGTTCCDTELYAYQSLYYSAAASALCTGDLPLFSDLTLPAWLTISGSRLILEEGHFSATSQVAADTLAAQYVAAFLANGLSSGNLHCGVFSSAEQSIGCAGPTETLSATGALDAGYSIAGNLLVLQAGHNQNPTSQALADAAALAELTAYFNAKIGTGLLVCEAPLPEPPPGICVGWWKADSFSLPDLTPVGGPGFEWVNQFLPGQRDMVQPTSAAQPLFRTNAFGVRPGIQLDGIDDFFSFLPVIHFESILGTDARAFTAFILFKQTAVDNNGVLLCNSNAPAHQSISRGLSNDMFAYDGVGGIFASSPLAIPQTDPKVMIWRNSVDVVVYPSMFRENKVNRGPFDQSALGFDLNRFGDAIGYGPSSGHLFFKGTVAEIILYCRLLTDAECDEVYDTYFKVKYPILPA